MDEEEAEVESWSSREDPRNSSSARSSQLDKCKEGDKEKGIDVSRAIGCCEPYESWTSHRVGQSNWAKQHGSGYTRDYPRAEGEAVSHAYPDRKPPRQNTHAGRYLTSSDDSGHSESGSRH